MDYEFFSDPITANPIAKVAVPQSAFGIWLTEEVGSDRSLLIELLKSLNQSSESWQRQGCEWSLEYEAGEVRLAHHSTTSNQDMPLSGEDELWDDDQNLTAEAGAEDVKRLITAWFDHIS